MEVIAKAANLSCMCEHPQLMGSAKERVGLTQPRASSMMQKAALVNFDGAQESFN